MGRYLVVANETQHLCEAVRPAAIEETERAEEQEARSDVDAMEAGLGHAEVRIERGDPGVVICEVAEEGGS